MSVTRGEYRQMWDRAEKECERLRDQLEQAEQRAEFTDYAHAVREQISDDQLEQAQSRERGLREALESIAKGKRVTRTRSDPFPVEDMPQIGDTGTGVYVEKLSAQQIARQALAAQSEGSE